VRRLAELEAAGIGRQRPGQDHQRQHDDAEEIGDQVAGEEYDLLAVHAARVPEEHQPEVSEAGDGADEVTRIAQAAQAVHDAIARCAQRQLDERSDHALAFSFSSAVIRRNASSSETSLRPCAIFHFRSSMVPYASRVPCWM